MAKKASKKAGGANAPSDDPLRVVAAQRGDAKALKLIELYRSWDPDRAPFVEYFEKNPPDAETVAALVSGAESRVAGMKGGASSASPSRDVLRSMFQTELSCGSRPAARAALVKRLSREHKVSNPTASKWLNDADIKSGRK